MQDDPTEASVMKPEDAHAWRRFLKLFGIALTALPAAVYLLLLALDPFDSGRLTNYSVLGVVDESPRTANVSRGRDPSFNSAVIGNSRGQMLDPERLSHDTGLSFVQLTIPGTGPREQLTVLHWFARNHREIGAIVMVADPVWCVRDPALPPPNPFPFWLYSDDTSEYLSNIFETRSLTHAWRRTLMWLGLRKRSRPDGYWDYEVGRTPAYRPTIPIDFTPASLSARPPEEPFPANERLRIALADLAADVPVVILVPPTFYSELPAVGTPEADRLAQCKGSLSELARGRSRGAFLDFEVDGEIARNPENFLDTMHYTSTVARQMETVVASSLRALERR
jgi:hypothetical protein